MTTKHVISLAFAFTLLFSSESEIKFVSASNIECNECIHIGGIWDEGFSSIEGAVKLAMDQHNHSVTNRQYKFQFLSNHIRNNEDFKLAKTVCNQLMNGVWAILASVEPHRFDTLHSYANTFQVPLITTSNLQNVQQSSSELMDYAISLQPDYHKAILDVIDLYKWDDIIYLYDSQDGLLRLQQLLQSMKPSKSSFTFRAMQRVSSSEEALNFLRTLELENRWSNKYVVLDSKDQFAKDLIIHHVQDDQMGRRNYHYLLAGLIMDEGWEEYISEYGALNITGFQVIDTAKPYVKSFLQSWRNLNPKEYPGAGKFISAQSALAYDSVQVLTESLSRYLDRNPNSALNEDFSQDLCDFNGPEQVEVFTKGKQIAAAIREIKFEGLTGNISFDEEGRRHNFSLDIVQMAIGSKTEKIGTWSDVHGLKLVPVPQINLEDESSSFRRNGTLIITSILMPPFLMLKQGGNYSGNDIYEGYIKDLIDILADKIGFNYRLQLIDDNYFGRYNPKMRKWQGMIGKLVAKEADVAAAPMTITSAREEVVDFTNPFMSVGVSIMIKRPTSKNIGDISFWSPFSGEIWMCIIFACVGVSVVLFLIKKVSLHELKNESTSKKIDNEVSTNWLWRNLNQLNTSSPRSIPGTVVRCAWWFFILILVSFYTANMVAILTSDRITSSVNNAEDLSKQSDIQFGVMKRGSTYQFFERSQYEVYSRMWRFMMKHEQVFTQSTQEGIDRVRTSNGKYAFFLESVMNDYVSNKYPCDTIKIGDNLNEYGYGLATPKGSPLRNLLDPVIMHLKEVGKLDELKNKWWIENSDCQKANSQKYESDAISLRNLASIFYILIVGIVLALLILLSEHFFKTKLDSSQNKVADGENPNSNY